MIANHGTASHVERLVRGYRQVKRAEALAQDNERYELRELAWHFSEDGSLQIKARLTPEQGARVVAGLDGLTVVGGVGGRPFGRVAWWSRCAPSHIPPAGLPA